MLLLDIIKLIFLSSTNSSSIWPLTWLPRTTMFNITQPFGHRTNADVLRRWVCVVVRPGWGGGKREEKRGGGPNMSPRVMAKVAGRKWRENSEIPADHELVVFGDVDGAHSGCQGAQETDGGGNPGHDVRAGECVTQGCRGVGEDFKDFLESWSGFSSLPNWPDSFKIWREGTCTLLPCSNYARLCERLVIVCFL